MLIHITNEDAAPLALHVAPHQTCDRMGLNAETSADCMKVTDHAAAVATASAVYRTIRSATDSTARSFSPADPTACAR